MSNNRHWFSLVAIAVATLVSPFPSDQGCPNFEPGPVDVIQFQNAVFRIEDGKPEDIGTAFLIDARNGYLLTAMHVVKNALSDPKIKLTGRTPLIPTSLDLVVVDSS